MSRGVLMYAHNNAEIDYFRIACANALMVQKNLKVPVSIVTDAGTLEYGKQMLGVELVNKCFDKVILVTEDRSFNNKRNYADSMSSTVLQFYNCNHWEAYDLTPYSETLFIDADYLIMSPALDNCWGSNNDFMINHTIISPGKPAADSATFIDAFSIRQYWATVIYFKKSDYAKSVFDIVKHVQENYTFYKQLYHFPNGMYRNDNAFSIAVHMLNGFTDKASSLIELPIAGLLMSWDTHDIHGVNGLNDITIFAEKDVKGTYMLARFKDQDIHIMNKWAINRNSDKLIEMYK